MGLYQNSRPAATNDLWRRFLTAVHDGRSDNIAEVLLIESPRELPHRPVRRTAEGGVN